MDGKSLYLPEAQNDMAWAFIGSPWGLLLAWLVVINLAAFLSFGLDKWRARRKAKNESVRRIPEKTLFLLAVLGGSVGALLGVEEGPPPALRPEGVAGIFGDALRSLPDLGGVTVESHCPPGAKVLGNRALLSDLIRNLILNAAAATAPGGTITLGCERQGSGWRLKVQDHGRGIPPEDLPHVTEAFYMADKSRTRARGGSGLGLSLCAAIAAAHGSKLAIESEPGRGTCVTLDLPDGEEETPCAQ